MTTVNFLLMSFVLTAFNFLSLSVRIKTTPGQNWEAEERIKMEEERNMD